MERHTLIDYYKIWLRNKTRYIQMVNGFQYTKKNTITSSVYISFKFTWVLSVSPHEICSQIWMPEKSNVKTYMYIQQCKKCGSENQHKTTSLTSHTISFTDLWLQTKSEGHTPTPADGLAIRDKLLYLPGQSHKLTGRQTLQKSILV